MALLRPTASKEDGRRHRRSYDERRMRYDDTNASTMGPRKKPYLDLATLERRPDGHGHERRRDREPMRREDPRPDHTMAEWARLDDGVKAGRLVRGAGRPRRVGRRRRQVTHVIAPISVPFLWVRDLPMAFGPLRAGPRATRRPCRPRLARAAPILARPIMARPAPPRGPAIPAAAAITTTRMPAPISAFTPPPSEVVIALAGRLGPRRVARLAAL